MEKSSLLERYYSRLIALERKSPLTAETYRFEIRMFLDWLDAEGLSLITGKTAAAVSPNGKPEGISDGHTVGISDRHTVGISDVIRYLVHRRNTDGLDSRSVAKAISALRSFSRFLEDEFQGSFSDFASLLQIPRRVDRLPMVHCKEDVDRLLSMIDVETTLGIRNRSLYELVYSAGLRISEAVNLNVDDIFLSKNLARVRGKGNKERLVVFGDEAAFWIKSYLHEGRLKLLGKRKSKALFLGRGAKRLSRKGIWKNYSSLAIQAGLSTKLHTLRHTFATELLAGGADLRSVQELLGHAEITTTQIYTHVDAGRLRENHRKYLPRLKTWSAYEK